MKSLVPVDTETSINLKIATHHTRAQLWEGGGRPPLSFFWKLKKPALVLEKNALIMSFLGLSFPFKMQF